MPRWRPSASWSIRAAAVALAGVLATACANAPKAAAARDPVAARPYRVHVPASYTPGKPAPLVVVLHGYGSSGPRHVGYFGFTSLAAARGALVAYPDGTRGRDGQRFWNASEAYGSDVDDVAYLTAVIDDVGRRHSVDARRVFIVGHSNGAMMAHRMACERADRVGGIVALAGSIPEPSRCRPTAPVAVLQVHGDADLTIPYRGGLGFAEQLLVSAPRSVETWARLDGCSGPLVDANAPPLDLDRSVPGAETRSARAACDAGAAELWTIAAGGHSPDLRVPDWGLAVFDWLDAHAR